jgi:pimeloyl-ACP methyl ester carboxylesterase
MLCCDPPVNARRIALGSAMLAGSLAAAWTGLHRSATTIKARRDPELDPLYALPADVLRHQIEASDGGSLHVLERGQGRPLLLIHGITLQAEVWSPQLHLLAERYRVLAMDVRGHGSSRAGSLGLGRKAAARDVVTVLEHFDLQDTVIAGHSMGGMILMEFIGEFSDEFDERVAGLAFMDTAAYHILPPPALSVAQAIGRRGRRRFENGKRVPQFQFGDNDLSWVLTRLVFGRRPSGQAVAQLRRLFEEVPQATSLLSGIDLLDHDARQVLAATPTPALVLVGSRDPLTPVHAARRIDRLLPHSRLEVLQGVGHQPMQERPYEVARLLDDFVGGLPAHPCDAAAVTSRQGDPNLRPRA